MLRHHAPFGDHGLAHLAGVLRAGDFVDLHRDLLAEKSFSCAAWASLLVMSWNVSGPVSRLQSPFGGGSRRGSRGELVGGDALALLAAAHAAWR